MAVEVTVAAADTDNKTTTETMLPSSILDNVKVEPQQDDNLAMVNEKVVVKKEETEEQEGEEDELEEYKFVAKEEVI